MSTQLIKYEAACRAIAECKSVDEVKAWADKAAAMQAYGRMAQDKTLEVDAAEIRIRAERRLGEMIAAQKAEGGLNRGAQLKGSTDGKSSVVVTDDRREKPTLADAGISKDLSSRAQKLAAVPAAEFEAELAAKRERDAKEGARVSARLEKAGARELKKAQPEPANDAHDDFDPVAELEKAHNEIVSLQELLKAAESDDLKAEAIKWRRIADQAQRRQSELMQTVADRERDLQRQHRILQRIGKAAGELDPSKLAAVVEAFYRGKVAA